MDDKVLTDADIVGYMGSLSNWGKWGSEDQLGSLNYITPERRVAAARLVRDGEAVATSLPLAITPGPGNPRPAHHFMMPMVNTPNFNCSLDYVGLAFHGTAISHIDALCHVFWDGKMYNGFSASEVQMDGAHKNAIESVLDKVIGRGVLLDIPPVCGKEWLEPGEAIYVDDLEAAEERESVQVGEGDILLVRTGRHKALRSQESDTSAWQAGGLPGLHASVLPWLHERRIAVLGSDGINDVSPSGFSDFLLPIHTVTIVAMGIHLLDNQDLERMVGACSVKNRYEFLFIVAPLHIERGTGSPVTGVAIF